MRKYQLAAVLLALGTLGPGTDTVSARSTETAIECQPHADYYLCEASPADDRNEYEWKVLGELTINLASGPMVSVGCDTGQSGALVLETNGPEGRQNACVEIDCGSQNPETTCANVNQTKSTGTNKAE